MSPNTLFGFKGHLKKARCEEVHESMASPSYSVNVNKAVEGAIVWLVRVGAHPHAANCGGVREDSSALAF